MKNSISKIITASLMVSGVSIGIGILGLPVDTGLAGFFPSLIIMLISWLFMLATGWIIARQISETQNDKEDLGGLFKRTLGKSGTILSNIGYLFLLYCILIAHIVGGSQILNSLGFLSLPIWVFVLLFFIVVSALTLLASNQIEKASSILLVLIIIVFMVMIVTLFTHIEPTRLEYTDWHYTISIIPIILVALTYQIIIPTLSRVLQNDFRSVMIAIFIGTFIPVVINLLWLISTIGALPLTGDNSILSAYNNNQPAVIPLSLSYPETIIKPLSIAFSLIVLMLSYVLQSTSLISYLNDFLSYRYGNKSIFYSRLLTFLPVIVISLLFPDIFLSLLDITGGFSIILICGILPALVGLKYFWDKGKIKKIAMFFLLIVFLFFMVIELLQEFNFLKISPNAEYYPPKLPIEKQINQ